jgi:hypothetical protein
MHTTALIQVVNHLKALSSDKTLLEKYEKLSESVREAAEQANEGIIRKIDADKNDLCQFLLSNEPVHWGYASYRIYEKINSEKLFGKSAADSIENLIENGRNYKQLNSKLAGNIKALSRFSENINKFCNLFELIMPATELVVTAEELQGPSLLLYFEGNLSIQSISDLERYSRLWDNILAVFCELAESENPPIEISNINNGNIILRVSVNSIILSSIMTGVTGILPVLPVKLKIKKIQNEILQLNLQNDYVGALENEIELLINTKALAAASKVVEGFSSIQSPEMTIQALAKCLKQILSFVEKGGKIEYHFQENTSDMAIPNQILTEAYHTVRELELIRDMTPNYN